MKLFLLLFIFTLNVQANSPLVTTLNSKGVAINSPEDVTSQNYESVLAEELSQGIISSNDLNIFFAALKERANNSGGGSSVANITSCEDLSSNSNILGQSTGGDFTLSSCYMNRTVFSPNCIKSSSDTCVSSCAQGETQIGLECLIPGEGEISTFIFQPTSSSTSVNSFNITNDSVRKVPATDPNYVGGLGNLIYSSENIMTSGNGYVSATVVGTPSNVLIGLVGNSTDLTTASTYTDMEYSLNIGVTNNIYFFEGSSYVTLSTQTLKHSAGDKYALSIEGSNIKVYQNEVEIYSRPLTGGALSDYPYKVGITINSAEEGFENIRTNDKAYVPFNN